MRPTNILEGTEQAESFLRKLEERLVADGAGELNLKEIVEKIGFDIDEFVSLEATLLLGGSRLAVSKLSSIGIVLGILYQKKVQEEKATAT